MKGLVCNGKFKLVGKFFDDTLGDVTLTSATESIYDFMSKLLPETAKLTVFDQCCGKDTLQKSLQNTDILL